LKALVALSAALALFGLLLLAACGGGDDEETTDTRTPAATQPAAGTQSPAETASPEAEETATPEAEESATPTAQVSNGELDPCALITKQEAEAIIGESVDDPLVTITELLASCLYSTPDFRTVNVDVLTYDNENDAESGFQLAIDINNYPAIEGIGDRAYDSRPIGDITVLIGKYELSVDVGVSSSDSDADFETAKELAIQAVDRLP
jgi:hypothetical protein